MKKYKLELLPEKDLLGELSFSEESGHLSISLTEKGEGYRDVLVYMIHSITRIGQFNVSFDENKLEVNQIVPLFVEAVNQELIRKLNIHPSLIID
jgi:hypothetical protein